jgi:hypothetical protein
MLYFALVRQDLTMPSLWNYDYYYDLGPNKFEGAQRESAALRHSKLSVAMIIYHKYSMLLLPVTMNIIIDLSNIMYNDLWM